MGSLPLWTLDEFLDDILKRCDVDPGKGVTSGGEQLARAIRSLQAERDEARTCLRALMDCSDITPTLLERCRAARGDNGGSR